MSANVATSFISLIIKSKPTILAVINEDDFLKQPVKGKNVAIKLYQTKHIETLKEKGISTFFVSAILFNKNPSLFDECTVVLSKSTPIKVNLKPAALVDKKVYLLYNIITANGFVKMYDHCIKNNLNLMVDASKLTQTNWQQISIATSTIGVYFTNPKVITKPNTTLLKLRTEIDTCDNIIFEQLAKRMLLINKIGRLKKEHKMPAFQPAKFLEHVLFLLNQTKGTHALPPQVITLYQTLHEIAVKQQTN